jgi:hypothetical protein
MSGSQPVIVLISVYLKIPPTRATVTDALEGFLFLFMPSEIVGLPGGE